MTDSQRAAALRACAALYGFAVAMSLHDRFLRPAPTGQLPGLMTKLGLDAAASFHFIGTLVLLPLLFAVAARGAATAVASGQRWAQVTFAAACFAALWTASLVRDPWRVALAPVLAIAVAIALRHFAAQFTRRDVVLLPAGAALLIAVTDVSDLAVDQTLFIAVGSLLTLRLIVAAIRPGRGIEPALAFALSPLALIVEAHFLGRHERYLGWPAMVIVLLTPLALRLTVSNSPLARRRIRLAQAWIIYPLACYAYLSATGLYTAEGKARVNLFEDAQHVVPAAEMARGERLYRDIIAPHGLIQDGLLDRPFVRRGGGNIGEILKGRGVIGGLVACAQYALGVAATGSAEGGVIAFFIGAALGIGGGTFRAVPAIAALAIILHAVRKRRLRLLVYGGAGVVVAVLTSLDFGFYVGVALLVSVLCFRGMRVRALAAAALGGASVAAIAAIGLGVYGILGDFLRTTLFEIARWGPFYALPPFAAPEALEKGHFIPDVLALVVDRSVYLYLLWIGALLFFAVALSARKTSRRIDVMTVFAAFTVICAVSYAERHHLHFQYGVPSLLAGTLFALARSRLRIARAFAPVMIVVLLVLLQPTVHLGIVSWLRHSRGPVDATLCELRDPPRARGALFTAGDAAMITSAQKYISTHLNPEETFFDFTNRGLLYYLTDRDCPIRQIEVAFYEPEAQQREVIAAIEHNPRIRAALVPPADGDDTSVDGVVNPTRAPLVWRYLQEHFEPDFQEGKVVFWKRKS